MSCTKKVGLSILVAFFFLIVSKAYAKNIGERLNLIPTAEIQEEYNTNVFNAANKNAVQTIFNDSQMDDFLSTYLAGLEVDYPLFNQRLILSGKKKLVRYAYYKSQNYESEFLSGKAEFNLQNFFIEPTYTYNNRVIPRINNINTKKQDFLKSSDVRIDTGYEASFWKFSAILEKEDYTYLLSGRIDRKVDTYSGSFSLTPSGKSWYSVALIHRKFSFSNTSEFNNREGDALISAYFIPNGKNLLRFRGGYRKKSFPLASEKDFDGFVGNIVFLHRVSSDTSLFTTVSRNTEVSYFVNTTYYLADSIQTGFAWQITAKINTTFSAKHAWINYKGISGSNPLRRYKYFTTDWNLTYMFHKNINCGLFYEFQKRGSNIEMMKFKNHKLRIKLLFSWE